MIEPHHPWSLLFVAHLPCLSILFWQAFQYVPLNGTGYYESWRVAQRDRVVEQFTAQIAKLRSNSTSW
jgi:hypothetical protein